MLATALAHGSHTTSAVNCSSPKPIGNDRIKKHKKQSDSRKAAGTFNDGIRNLSTSTPLPKSKRPKLQVPVPCHQEDNTTSNKGVETFAVDKLLRQLVERRFQPFK